MTDLYDQLVGVPWYRAERFVVARLRMADADGIPEDYATWLERAERREEATRASGATPTRVYVDDDRFITFCADQNIERNSRARSRYAAAFCTGSKANMADYSNPDFRYGAKRW